MKSFINFDLPNLANVRVPDNSAPITNVHALKVRKFPEYVKITMFGDKAWSVRVRDEIAAATAVSNLMSGNNPSLYFEGYASNNYPVFEVGASNSLNANDYYSDAYNRICSSLETLDMEPPIESKVTKLDKLMADPTSVSVEETIKAVNNKKENKTMKNTTTTIINGALTLDKTLAFMVNGTYKTVSADGKVTEVLPQLVLMKDFPALIPTIAKNISAGDFYVADGSLYKAIADNKVIELSTGKITEIAVATIPMTDKVVVYKPVFDGNKASIKEVVKAQMLAQAGIDPLMLSTLTGKGDADFKDYLMLQFKNGGNAMSGLTADPSNPMSAMLPLMMLGKDKGDKMDMKDIMMFSMMGNANKGGNNAANINTLLPLMFMEDKEGSDLESLVLYQAMAGQNGANSALPLLMLMGDKKDKKDNKKSE